MRQLLNFFQPIVSFRAHSANPLALKIQHCWQGYPVLFLRFPKAGQPWKTRKSPARFRTRGRARGVATRDGKWQSAHALPEMLRRDVAQCFSPEMFSADQPAVEAAKSPAVSWCNGAKSTEAIRRGQRSSRTVATFYIYKGSEQSAGRGRDYEKPRRVRAGLRVGVSKRGDYPSFTSRVAPPQSAAQSRKSDQPGVEGRGLTRKFVHPSSGACG
jgi:hypothetical protein